MEASTFTPVLLVVKARSGLDMATEASVIRRVGFEEDNPDLVF